MFAGSRAKLLQINGERSSTRWIARPGPRGSVSCCLQRAFLLRCLPSSFGVDLSPAEPVFTTGPPGGYHLCPAETARPAIRWHGSPELPGRLGSPAPAVDELRNWRTSRY